MLGTCDMIDDPDCPKYSKYRDPEASQNKKSECTVKNTMEAISHFTNLWKRADKKSYIALHLGLVFQKK